MQIVVELKLKTKIEIVGFGNAVRSSSNSKGAESGIIGFSILSELSGIGSGSGVISRSFGI